MAATLRVDVSIPKSETKSIEVKWCHRALELAAHEIRRTGGAQTSGTITGDGGIVLGSWTYAPGASS